MGYKKNRHRKDRRKGRRLMQAVAAAVVGALRSTSSAATSNDEPCPRCEGRLFVTNEFLGTVIRCPQCTVREPRKDQNALERLTAAEMRRVSEASRKIESAVHAALYGKSTSQFWISDPVLRAVDRIMQRWAVGHGNGDPPESIIARPPPLDDETQMVIDDLLKPAAPTHWRIKHHVFMWYRTETPNYLIAREMGISPRQLYRQHEWVLDWLRVQFEASKHPTLLRLMKLADPM